VEHFYPWLLAFGAKSKASNCVDGSFIKHYKRIYTW